MLGRNQSMKCQICEKKNPSFQGSEKPYKERIVQCISVPTHFS